MKVIREICNVLFALALCFSVSVGVAQAEDQEPATGTIAAATPAVIAAPVPLPAADAVTGTVMLSGLNRFVFRGYELSSHSVVLEPSVTVNYKGFSLTLWNNLDSNQTATQTFDPGNFRGSGTNSNAGKAGLNETDLILNYTYNIGKLALTGGFIYYGTHYADQTEELFVSLSYDMIAHPTLSVNRDIDISPGTYINISFSQSIPVYQLPSGDMTLDLGAGFGYEAGDSNFWNTYSSVTHAYTGSRYSAFHDSNVKVGFTIPLTKKFSVQPVAQYWFPLSGDASRIVFDKMAPTGIGSADFNPSGHLDQTFVYGLNVTWNF